MGVPIMLDSKAESAIQNCDGSQSTGEFSLVSFSGHKIVLMSIGYSEAKNCLSHDGHTETERGPVIELPPSAKTHCCCPTHVHRVVRLV